MKRGIRGLIVSVGAAVAIAGGACAASAVTAPTALAPVPTSVSVVGTLKVERYGLGDPAVILIPGLACGSWVWKDEIRALAPAHTVYAVTLAGFDGQPPATGPLLDEADGSLLKLIQTEQLDRPVLVGHSMGGFLALRFGEQHAGLVRGIVAVDGLPVFPSLANMPPDSRAAAAAQIAAGLRTASPAQFAHYQARAIVQMVTDPVKAAAVAKLVARSNPAATATYLQGMLSDDLRPNLAGLTVPTLEIAPVPTKPASFEPPAAASESLAERAAQYKSFYSSLFAGAPNVKVQTILNSRHFVMIDQPAALQTAIASFLATL